MCSAVPSLLWVGPCYRSLFLNLFSLQLCVQNHKSISDRSDQTFDQAYLICNNANNGIRVWRGTWSSEITTWTYCLLFVSRVPINMSTQAPTFTQPLQSVVALEGSAATFEAQVSGKSIIISKLLAVVHLEGCYLFRQFAHHPLQRHMNRWISVS